jgi:hypothetical protein
VSVAFAQNPDVLVKGAIVSLPFGGVRIASASRCWEKTTRIDLRAIDKVIRVYGTNGHGPPPLDLKPGYFAYEVTAERPTDK